MKFIFIVLIIFGIIIFTVLTIILVVPSIRRLILNNKYIQQNNIPNPFYNQTTNYKSTYKLSIPFSWTREYDIFCSILPNQKIIFEIKTYQFDENGNKKVIATEKFLNNNYDYDISNYTLKVILGEDLKKELYDYVELNPIIKIGPNLSLLISGQAIKVIPIDIEVYKCENNIY